MKKFILLLVVISIVFIIWNRDRLYVRDPFGSVFRNGTKESGAQIFINYSNDALIENDRAPMYITLLQHGQRIGVPATLRCMHFVVCLTDADVATLVVVQDGARVASMNRKEIDFRDGRGRECVVRLH